MGVCVKKGHTPRATENALVCSLFFEHKKVDFLKAGS